MKETAGTDDFILKQLELELLLREVPENSRVVDAGCGNGDTLIELAKKRGCSGAGFDFSEGMVALARENAQSKGLTDLLDFMEGELLVFPEQIGAGFDCAITERSLINLAGEKEQREAFSSIIGLLRPGGVYFMIESSAQGLERINKIRLSLGLEAINPPWHNVFLDEGSVSGWGGSAAELLEVIPFSSTYYFLSRVVYAKLAADEGEELRYDSDINLLSMRLPIIGDFGPARMWKWHRV
ncbi:MAG: class I SAM-dependent methyltransferase [Candidatus Nitrospinota bacterium M3_3B_026]